MYEKNNHRYNRWNLDVTLEEVKKNPSQLTIKVGFYKVEILKVFLVCTTGKKFGKILHFLKKKPLK